MRRCAQYGDVAMVKVALQWVPSLNKGSTCIFNSSVFRVVPSRRACSYTYCQTVWTSLRVSGMTSHLACLSPACKAWLTSKSLFPNPTTRQSRRTTRVRTRSTLRATTVPRRSSSSRVARVLGYDSFARRLARKRDGVVFNPRSIEPDDTHRVGPDSSQPRSRGQVV